MGVVCMLTLIAMIKAKPENRKLVRAKCLCMLEPTRKEEGCVSYDFFDDDEDENIFVFVENWENEDALERHDESEHLQKFKQSLDDNGAELIVLRLTKSER